MKLTITPRTLHFREPATTSRGVYTDHQIWIVEARDEARPGIVGLGECAPLPDLSCDASPDYEATLRQFADMVEATGAIPYDMLRPYPSMLFGLETALLHLRRGSAALFDTAFARGEEGIPTNGLVWMGDHEQMLGRMEAKIAAGFHCIKLKIGAIDFDDELDLLRRIRERFSPREMTIRLDANGAFAPDEALYKLELLSQFAVHSIEQPIRQKQWGDMARLCRDSPLPIALDEELIGVNLPSMRRHTLSFIKPAYIVVKPSLHGGMEGARNWIETAESLGIGSWITSALEGNIGLNAVAQLAADIYGPGISMPQGLGTGALFTDNFPSHLEMRGECLWSQASL